MTAGCSSHCCSPPPPPPSSSSSAPHLKSLPSDADLTSSHFPESQSSQPPLRSLINRPSPPLFIVLYILFGWRGEKGHREVLRVLHTFSEMVAQEDMPASVKERLVLQVSC